MSRRKNSDRATRARGAKTRTRAPAGKPPRKPKATRLDYRKAAELAAKGATLANIARGAGARAQTQAAATSAGARIMRRLRERGALQETFSRLGYDMERFARQVIDQTEAERTVRMTHKGEVVAESQEPDWQARTAAREQFMRAIGLMKMPIELEVTTPALAVMDETVLVRLAAGEVDEQELEQLAQSLGVQA